MSLDEKEAKELWSSGMATDSNEWEPMVLACTYPVICIPSVKQY